MEGMKDVKSDGSLGDETEKVVVFIDPPFMITMLVDLSALKVSPAHFRAIVQWESKVFAPQAVEYIMFRSSMKALIGGNEILFRWVWWLQKSILELCSYQPKKYRDKRQRY